MAPKERQRPFAVDPSLKGWVFVVLSGRDGLVGKLVIDGDQRMGAIYTKLFPVYSVGSVVGLTTGSSIDSLKGATINFMDRLEDTFDMGRAGGMPIRVQMQAFAFLEDLSEDARKRIALKIEETERAYDAQRTGLVAV